MFNMDMISRQPDGAIRLDGGPKGKVLVDLLVRLAPQVPIEMRVDTHPDWLMRSDQGAFLGAGVPAVLFSCEDHEDYHKVTDHADKCDEQLMARVAALVTAAVRTYAAEMTPRFDRSPLLAEDGTQRRPIRVGRTMPNAPYWKPATRRDPDRGLDAALLAELAKATGWNFEERPVSPTEQCTALADGEVDILLNGASAGLVRVVGLPRPIVAVEPAYLDTSGPALLVAKDSTITAESDLANLKIAVRANSAAALHLAAQRPGVPLAFVAEPDGSIAAKIEKGELDAFAGDALSLEARAARDPAFRVVRLGGAPTAILCRADDAKLREALGAAVKALADSGELARIIGKQAAARGADASRQ
jgi:ABC-type amino acid transport substrate-binding protein